MLDKKLKMINVVFSELGVRLKVPLASLSFCDMDGSVTNQFIKAEGLNGQTYLIRLNGQLWPPFSRRDEMMNLESLDKNSINTTVLYNNKKAGFQICELIPMQFRFNKRHRSYQSFMTMLLAKKLRRVHECCHFEGKYPVHQTVSSAFSRQSPSIKKVLVDYYHFVISLMGVLARDSENHVSCHNDLLPSSVYVRHGRVSIVDWEYSAINHRAYDLALFSIKAKLSTRQEREFVRAYDSRNTLNTEYSLSLIKPVVRFLLLLWSRPKTVSMSGSFNFLRVEMQQVLVRQSAKQMISEARLGFFNIKSRERFVRLA